MASGLKRPRAFSGIGSTRPVAEAGTSKVQPWSWPIMSPALRVVSSQVIHEPQGVTPPAQFTAVPARLRCWLTRARVFRS